MASPLLVLTDFSPAADRALTYADALAERLDTTIVLLHVRRTSLLDPDLLTGRIAHLSEGEVATALSDRSARLSVPCVVEVTNDQVADAVTEATQRLHPCLLVVGKPDTEHTPDELVTTTSLQLVQAATCPLLVVPVGAAVASPPAHITLAVDGEAFALSPESANIPHLLHELGAPLTVVHITTADEAESDSAQLYLDSVQRSGLAMELKLPEAQVIRHHDLAEGIQQAVLNTQADLLLVVARRHSLLGSLFHNSVTAQVVRHSIVPVLVLPSED